MMANAHKPPSHHHGSAFQTPLRGGMTLWEVILALAILAISLAVLGELARQGMRNAETARAASEAQLLCESKLAAIAAGITRPEPVTDASWEIEADEEIATNDAWLYSVEIDATDLDGLLAVRVTVTQDQTARKRPVSVSLSRWIIDPDAADAE